MGLIELKPYIRMKSSMPVAIRCKFIMQTLPIEWSNRFNVPVYCGKNVILSIYLCIFAIDVAAVFPIQLVFGFQK